MTNQIDSFSPDPHNPLRSWGLWAVTFGALSLVLVLMHIGLPFSEPAPPVGTQIGEIAGDMSRAAWRSFFGLEQEVVPVEPQPVPFTLYLGYVGAALGVVAIFLSVISGVKHENWRYAVYGTGLGSASVLFYFFWWVAVLICGVLMLIAIIENLGSFFSFGLWD